MYLAWPPEAYEAYQNIKNSQDDVREMVKICLEEGRRYKAVVVALLPIIEERTLEISEQANEIIDMLPAKPRPGPRPKWYRIAEEVEELASNIALIVDEALRPALRNNDILVIEAGLTEIRRQNEAIKRSLKQIPRPAKPADMSVWEDVASKVNEAFEE